MPATTELRYFNNDEMLETLNGPGDKEAVKRICKDEQEYLSHFADFKNEKAVGECTTSYLYSPTALNRIKSELGSNIKLIVILRNPVSRAFSNYQYYVRRGKEKASFEEAIVNEDKREKEGWNNGWFNIRHSFYYKNVQKLIQSGLSFKIIFFEDLISDPKTTVKDVYKFLEVDNSIYSKNLSIRYNKGGIYKFRKISSWLLKPSELRSTVKAITPSYLVEQFRKRRESFLASQTRPLKIDDKMKNKLHKLFEEDVEKLAELISFDKSKWDY